MICHGQPIRSRSSIASAASFIAAAGFAQSGSNSRTRRRASRVGYPFETIKKDRDIDDVCDRAGTAGTEAQREQNRAKAQGKCLDRPGA